VYREFESGRDDLRAAGLAHEAQPPLASEPEKGAAGATALQRDQASVRSMRLQSKDSQDMCWSRAHQRKCFMCHQRNSRNIKMQHTD
jgi:hypothetical protein